MMMRKFNDRNIWIYTLAFFEEQYQIESGGAATFLFFPNPGSGIIRGHWESSEPAEPNADKREKKCELNY
jgi:hypothetical protein